MPMCIGQQYSGGVGSDGRTIGHIGAIAYVIHCVAFIHLCITVHMMYHVSTMDIVLRGVDEGLVFRLRREALDARRSFKEYCLLRLSGGNHAPSTEDVKARPAAPKRVEAVVKVDDGPVVREQSLSAEAEAGKCPHHPNMTRAYCAKLYKGAKCRI